jgi:hypothetical protein
LVSSYRQSAVGGNYPEASGTAVYYAFAKVTIFAEEIKTAAKSIFRYDKDLIGQMGEVTITQACSSRV